MSSASYLFELPETVTLALLVIAGKYGNGEERENSLIREGYDYETVQDCVNEIFPILKKYGYRG